MPRRPIPFGTTFTRLTSGSRNALRSALERGEHQLQHGLLAEAVRDDLEPPPLLAEEALQEEPA